MYDRFPYIPSGPGSACVAGWTAIANRLQAAVPAGRAILSVECYPGAFVSTIKENLVSRFQPSTVIDTDDLLKDPSEIDCMLDPYLGDDPVFAKMNPVEIVDFFAQEKLKRARSIAANHTTGLLLIIGTGASLIQSQPDVLVYADMARWEIQLRQRRKEIANFGAKNFDERASLKYKRAFFVDWRAADRLKLQLFAKIDFLLDTNVMDRPKMISGENFRAALQQIVRRPFRVVPFFDPGPWGGHWMEKVCNLPENGAPNHAWCFDCVPEENSLLLGFGNERVEVPSLNLVLSHPRELLGAHVFDIFGAEFPIRFDFLDTMGGGNLSLQVHPLTQFIRDHFGMEYTQDESYYLLDAEKDACVYLGLKEGIQQEEMIADLRRAQKEGLDFPATNYVNQFPAKKHDHFLIPAGTIHCSGKNSMVLEISATPYIFTFKLWDWGRVGLDGRPRPIHLEHGIANIQWNRTTNWVKRALINRFEPLAQGDGWREERTGLHELEFIETRRHWFTSMVPHNTDGGVHVLNLVEGEEAIVESPTNTFEPFIVHYAETFIVPGCIGAYTLRPHGPSLAKECGTIQASVRKRASQSYHS